MQTPKLPDPVRAPLPARPPLPAQQRGGATPSQGLFRAPMFAALMPQSREGGRRSLIGGN